MAAGRSARNPSGIAFGGGGLWGVALGYSWERMVVWPLGWRRGPRRHLGRLGSPYTDLDRGHWARAGRPL